MLTTDNPRALRESVESGLASGRRLMVERGLKLRFIRTCTHQIKGQSALWYDEDERDKQLTQYDPPLRLRMQLYGHETQRVVFSVCGDIRLIAGHVVLYRYQYTSRS